MKKYIIGFVFGAVLSASVSVGAVVNTQNTPLLSGSKLTEEQQINLGHKYDLYTGKKLRAPKLSPIEKRFRAIEARLKALENNQ